MGGHPGVASVIMGRVVPEDRLEARQGCDQEQRESLRGNAALIQPGARDPDGDEEPHRVPQSMALTALHALAAVLPALRTAYLGRLDQWTRDPDRARRGLTACGPTRLFASRRAHLAPGPVVTPLGKVVIGRTRGEERVGQPIPLPPTPMELPHRVEDFPQLDLAGASSSLARLGGGEPRCHQGPVRVRQIGWLSLSGLVFFSHCCALLCCWDMRELSNKSRVLPSPISG
jgi:hypothetical protein